MIYSGLYQLYLSCTIFSEKIVIRNHIVFVKTTCFLKSMIHLSVKLGLQHCIFCVNILKFVLIIFIFYQMTALQTLWKMLFTSSKKLFSFSKYSKKIPLLLQVFQIQKGNLKWNNLYIMNWLAWISICNFWNNSKTALYHIIKLGQVIHHWLRNFSKLAL